MGAWDTGSIVTHNRRNRQRTHPETRPLRPFVPTRPRDLRLSRSNVPCLWRPRPSLSSGQLQVRLEGAGLLLRQRPVHSLFTAQSAEPFFFRVFLFFFPAGTLSSR